jgi:hypothetical protein
MLLLVGAGMAMFQQILGINTVIYFGATILKFAGYATSTSVYEAVYLGIINMIGAIVALLDKVGAGRNGVASVARVGFPGGVRGGDRHRRRACAVQAGDRAVPLRAGQPGRANRLRAARPHDRLGSGRAALAWLTGLLLAALLAFAIRPLLVGLLPVRLRRASWGTGTVIGGKVVAVRIAQTG